MGDNGLCLSTPDCASCGKTKVDVEITIDNYGGETTYDIKDASDNIVMQGSGWPANSVNSFWKCFSSGSYTFTITDAYGDGICCSYGSGGYKVEVDDKEVASGGDFGSKEEKTFDVVAGPPTAPPTVTSPTIPPPVTSPTTPPPITTPSAPFLQPHQLCIQRIPHLPCTPLKPHQPCIQPLVRQLLSLPTVHLLLILLIPHRPFHQLTRVK